LGYFFKIIWSSASAVNDRLRLAWVILAITFVSPLAAAMPVDDPPQLSITARPPKAEFLKETVAHILEVSYAMMMILYQSPQAFPGVTIESALLFAEHHDEPKIDQHLQMWKKLYRIYGVNLASLPEESTARKRGQKIIDELHFWEDYSDQKFFERQKWIGRNGKPTAIASQHQRLASIADKIATWRARRSEFGKNLLPASKYLDSKEDREIAARIEPLYESLIEIYRNGGSRILTTAFSLIDLHSNLPLRTASKLDALDPQPVTKRLSKCWSRIRKLAAPALFQSI